MNEGWRYEIRATGVVKRESGGEYVEQYTWSDLHSNGSPFALPPASLEFRQVLSLDAGKPPVIPKLAVLHPMLIGPVTDLLTFYADLWLANRLGKLAAVGDHLYHQHGTPASWADGNRVVLGESSVDFDFALEDIDPSSKVATLVVRHVPPKQPRVRLPAVWMHQQVADTPNNWVNVVREAGKYVAAVGKETFDVTMKVSLADGKILSGTMENHVIARERDCLDAPLTNCGDPRPREILRHITVSLDR
ncbi:MAG: hypothetical protein HY235_03560 [Acidobacteria bacterium]|nr:hypothetical protein [Acidobacteriota bacterium]